ncbi:MAG TPA: hypothetical protein EYH40_02615 [Desulfurococcales archaeon]|nr:hypothetical protein [Desulfurococcales archaeon]
MSLSRELLDKIARAACWACVERVDKAQVSKLLEVLESTGSVDYVIAFIARQYGRGYIRRNVSRELIELLSDKSIRSDLNKAREALGLFRWLYEASYGRRVPSCNNVNFDSLIKSILG